MAPEFYKAAPGFRGSFYVCHACHCSANSYGFRPNKNAHQALKQAVTYVAGGKCYEIDLDLEKFFDEVNHHRLMWL